MSAQYPFSALVALDDLCTALLLCAVHPGIGGVLIRGEKGTAKSTAVRALGSMLPAVEVVAGCRFGCDPAAPAADCPDGPHPAGAAARTVPARVVELPVGAAEERVAGALDLRRVLADGVAAFEPGLLAAAHRGVLYVDEVNLLADHLVDVLLDAAALGTHYVEREGVSVRHPARFVLVGTMNPEEGELRPQLLDRFGLTVEVTATREPALRAEVVRRRLAYEADPATFLTRYADADADLGGRVAAARALLPSVRLGDPALRAVTAVCAAFDVDGLRADLVTAKTATAWAAWEGRADVTFDDVARAARLSLPHRRRRNPFDAPGLPDGALDEALQQARDAYDQEPTPPPGSPRPGAPSPSASSGPGETGPGQTGPSGTGPDGPDADTPDGGGPDAGRPDAGGPHAPGAAGSGADDPATPGPDQPDGSHATGATGAADDGPGGAACPRAGGDPDAPADSSSSAADSSSAAAPPPATLPARDGAPLGSAGRRLQVPGRGTGAAGRRSAAQTSTGRTVGAAPMASGSGPLHVAATLRAAALRGAGRPRAAGPLRPLTGDLRRAVRAGRESNLVLFCVDTSGSMAAATRLAAVAGAVQGLLLDAYQRRDTVAVVTFRAGAAELVLPPTGSVDTAAARLTGLPVGGRTPLAAGLTRCASVLAGQRVRDPLRRPLLVVVTDGRATQAPAGSTDTPVAAAHRSAAGLRAAGVASVVVDCETGPVRLGLAADLAGVLGAPLLPLAALDGLATAAPARAAHPAVA